MTKAELLKFIDDNIYTNGNNEITANVLNPVLDAIVEWGASEFGDLTQLNTATNTSLVAAINEINTAISNINSTGIKLLSGTTDPNETPPTTFNTADFYMLETELGLPVELYQYNGYSWVSTQQAGGDGSTISVTYNGDTTILNTALQDIYDATFDDELISIGTITQNGALPAEITIPADAQWRINNTEYTNAAAFVTEIDTEATGFRRVDIIVATVTGFQVIQGTPDNLGVAVQPVTPIDTILVSVIQIDGLVIGAPTQPETGGKYITKESKGAIEVEATGNLPRQAQTTYRMTSGATVDGIAAASSEAQDGLYDGQSYFLWNDTGADVTLKHLAAAGEIKIHFPDGEDYILPINTIAHFVFIKAAAPRIYFVGSKAANGIPLTGTEVGSPVTGTIEANPENLSFAVTTQGFMMMGAADNVDIDNEATRYSYTGFESINDSCIVSLVSKLGGDSAVFQVLTSTALGARLIAGAPKGIEYGLDYSANYSPRSLTDKQYVDDAIAAAGGGGAVDSVNGQTGVVVLDLDDIGDGTTNKAFTDTEKTKLSGIETGATANQSDATTNAAIDTKLDKSANVQAIVSLTQAAYDALTPVSTTVYLITA